MRRLLWLPVIALQVACQVPDDRGPQRVRIFGQDAPGGTYGLRTETLQTLESAREIRGAAASLRGGGGMILENALFSGELTADTEEEVRAIKLVRGDSAPEADYAHDDGGLVPLDWETLAMFTFYRHMERGHEFFRSLGVPAPALRPTLSYYNVRFTAFIAWGVPLVLDNAAYAPLVDVFLLFPSVGAADGVPLFMNEGVVVHELSHAVKHRVLHGDRRLPTYLSESWPNDAVNAYRSDDEGLADFFAALFTGDSNFIRVSGLDHVDRELVEDPVRQNRHFTQTLYDAQFEDPARYDPYVLGSALASWLWETGDSLDERRRIAMAVVETLKVFVPDNSYRLATLIHEIVERLDAPLASRACALLDLRLEGAFREVPRCDIVR